MKFMIHTYPARLWYVDEYLIPSMTSQGIPREDIEIWNDEDGSGCLFSCFKSFYELRQRPGDTWHLQDDVLICRDFALRCSELDSFSGLVSGFGCPEFGPTMEKTGEVPAVFAWFAFQCTRIPNRLAGECAEWFFNEAIYQDHYREMVGSNKCDDSFFYDFLVQERDETPCFNVDPCLVEHVDRLIGGSAVNQHRDYWASAIRFADQDLVHQLAYERHHETMLLLYRQRAAYSTD